MRELLRRNQNLPAAAACGLLADPVEDLKRISFSVGTERNLKHYPHLF